MRIQDIYKFKPVIKVSYREVKMRIRQESVQHLEQVFFPKKIITIDELPRSPSGKIDRKALSLKAQNL